MKIDGLDVVGGLMCLTTFLLFAMSVYQMGRNAIPPLW